jgi:hypothetical protein
MGQITVWRSMGDYPKDGSPFLIYRPLRKKGCPHQKYDVLVALHYEPWDGKYLMLAQGGSTSLENVLAWAPLPPKPDLITEQNGADNG